MAIIEKITSIIPEDPIDVMEEITTITVKKTTREKLVKIGKFGQTFDELICQLLEGGEI